MKSEEFLAILERQQRVNERQQTIIEIHTEALRVQSQIRTDMRDILADTLARLLPPPPEPPEPPEPQSWRNSAR